MTRQTVEEETPNHTPSCRMVRFVRQCTATNGAGCTLLRFRRASRLCGRPGQCRTPCRRVARVTGGKGEVRFWWAELRGPDGAELPPNVRERIAWYEWHKRRQRFGHYLSEAVLLLLSASIPACAAAGASVTVTGILGALVVVSAGLRQLFRWGENWVRVSSVLTALQGELVNWSCGSPPYNGADSLAVLASRTEELVRSEAGEWAETRSSVPQSPVAGPPTSAG
ncbi:DUF4231 domain-containing protein [Streptomyces sp. NPDC048279]|uniref:DUF4231 domain-containing protein n=1 Tax=Streptomyces sp. NPDC048279 TaxID=3154714 RepID=UPI00343357C9